MEQNLHSPEVYDFRQYDRIWQRVAPGLEPYPAPDQATGEAVRMNGESPRPQERMLSVREESRLPGAQQDPCCMGSAAAEMLEVLAGFIEEELADQCALRELTRCAPMWAVPRLRELAAQEGEHARRLMAVWYLITGGCYHPQAACRRSGGERWCEALRQRYHDAACSGLNYLRAADGTTDPCLAKLLRELGDEEYRHAEMLLRMLEKSLRT